MEIQRKKVSEINPAIYNPRKDLQPGDPEYEKLKKSILEFDMVEPLVWNKRTGNLIGGHQRLKILKELGIEHVEVSVVDLSEVKEKALNLALNKISGEWDFPRLKDLLEELDTGDFDMEITGFDLKEIEDLMSQFHVAGEGLTDDDAVPEATESISRRGDLWQLGNHRLLCGDATFITDVERLMGGEKADMVFTDPPYGVDYDGGTRRREKLVGDINTDIYSEFLVCIPYQDKTPLYMWFALGLSDEIYRALKQSKWEVRAVIIWNKNQAQFGALSAHYKEKKEPLIYACRHKCSPAWYGPTNEVTVWDCSRAAKNEFHPTQKPVELAERAIKNSSQLHNIILDLFGGSGSTLIACEKLDRRCYMMEISEHYVDVIIARYEAFTGKKAVRIDG